MLRAITFAPARERFRIPGRECPWARGNGRVRKGLLRKSRRAQCPGSCLRGRELGLTSKAFISMAPGKSRPRQGDEQKEKGQEDADQPVREDFFYSHAQSSLFLIRSYNARYGFILAYNLGPMPGIPMISSRLLNPPRFARSSTMAFCHVFPTPGRAVSPSSVSVFTETGKPKRDFCRKKGSHGLKPPGLPSPLSQ